MNFLGRSRWDPDVCDHLVAFGPRHDQHHKVKTFPFKKRFFPVQAREKKERNTPIASTSLSPRRGCLYNRCSAAHRCYVRHIHRFVYSSRAAQDIPANLQGVGGVYSIWICAMRCAVPIRMF